MSCRFLPIAALLLLSGCVSAPARDVSRWHGRTEGKVEVWLTSEGSSLPAYGWLVKSEKAGSEGSVRYTKWWPSDEYSDAAPFIVESAWRQDADHIGLLKANGSATEFCTLNPEHGAFMDGDSVVHTYSWDYCAQLSRK